MLSEARPIRCDIRGLVNSCCVSRTTTLPSPSKVLHVT